jgi:hypothetical protein
VKRRKVIADACQRVPADMLYVLKTMESLGHRETFEASKKRFSNLVNLEGDEINERGDYGSLEPGVKRAAGQLNSHRESLRDCPMAGLSQTLDQDPNPAVARRIRCMTRSPTCGQVAAHGGPVLANDRPASE